MGVGLVLKSHFGRNKQRTWMALRPCVLAGLVALGVLPGLARRVSLSGQGLWGQRGQEGLALTPQVAA